MNERIRVESLAKNFPGVKALDEVSFSLESNKIYALVGENGAGKSTLVKILSGIYKPDGGRIFVNGKEARIKDPTHARKYYKIDVVFQEHSLIPELSIAENIFLTNLENFYDRGFLSYQNINTAAEKILERINFSIDVRKLAKDIHEDEKTFVEFAKVLSRNPDTVILDEITAALESDDVEGLFKILMSLKEEGKTIIFISHRLEEVLKFSDEIIVFKDGRLVGNIDNSSKQDYKSKRDKIINYMTGIEGGLKFPERLGVDSKGKVVLSVKNLNSKHLKGINLEIRENEIVGLAGLRGQGQSELLRTLAGIMSKSSADIKINGQEVRINSTFDAIKAGFFYISDKRDKEELWLSHDIIFNIVLMSISSRTRGGFIKKKEEKKLVKDIAEKLQIETARLDNYVQLLSGGNRQKVVLAKYLLAKPRILFLDQPTIGLDVGAKMEIYKILRMLAKKGIPTLTLLTDREEILQFPDRLLVMFEGEIIKEFRGAGIDEEKLLHSYYK
ncbi:MAG: sugar ABC transporter ATP-binding protein [Actinomycetota bacterium]